MCPHKVLEQYPKAAVFTTNTMNMAPSGKILAVGGTKGLHLSNFTGASQATPRTSLLTTASTTGLHWDNSDHLYAISSASGKLFAFTITPPV
jgi:hypothetical protein